MKTITIKSRTIINDAGEYECYPVIPFSEIPAGQRNAGPDKDGNLVWTVIVED